MEQSPSYKRKIQIQFQAYCYKILRGEAVDYYRYVNYLQKHEKSIENLSSEESDAPLPSETDPSIPDLRSCYSILPVHFLLRLLMPLKIIAVCVAYVAPIFIFFHLMLSSYSSMLRDSIPNCNAI